MVGSVVLISIFLIILWRKGVISKRTSAPPQLPPVRSPTLKSASNKPASNEPASNEPAAEEIYAEIEEVNEGIYSQIDMDDYAQADGGYLIPLRRLQKNQSAYDLADPDYHYQKTLPKKKNGNGDVLDQADPADLKKKNATYADGSNQVSLEDLEKVLPKEYKVVGFKGGAVQVVKVTQDYVDFEEVKDPNQNVKTVP